MKILLFVFLSVVLTSCKEKKQNAKSQEAVTTNTFKQYNFEQPTTIWKLPSLLNEVSGIFLLNDSILLCQEDERGSIYLYNLNTSVIVKIISFGNADDYEDITFFNDVVYLVNSKGTIVSVANYLQTPLVTKYNTILSQKNDVEGLCYDAITNSFLIVCKEQQGNGMEDKDVKNLCQFQLATKQIVEKPLFHFTEKNFKPSAIAVHPISTNIFVLSASKEKLLELARDGSTIANYDLKKNIFPQPEGLAFAKNGDLYISNEASDGAATILFFKYVKE